MIRPLHDQVVIRRKAVEEKSKGGIIIPDNAKEKPLEGEVLAVGPGKLKGSGEDEVRVIPLVKVGDKVLFSKYAGTETTIDGEEVVIQSEDSILGVIEPD